MQVVEKAAPERWVRESPVADVSGVERKYTYLLAEKQVRYRPGELRVFVRNVVRINNSNDFHLVNPVRITLNNSQETCVFHRCIVRNDDHERDVTGDLEFRELQREQELERAVYTESRTLIAYVEGLQVGDTVEYAFTIISRSQQHRSNFTFSTPVAFGVSVYELLLKVDYENSGKECRVRKFKSIYDYETDTFPGGQPYEYSAREVEAFLGEPGVPAIEMVLPSVEFSDFVDWQEFGRENLHAYREKASDPAIAALVEKVAAGLEGWARIEAVINYVKSKIGYHSISIDHHSYLPHSPLDTIRQNYGDCKDKSLLLKQMLETMGLEAAAVLVNTFLRRNTVHRLVAWSCFDHVIVAFSHEGSRYFVDPTDSLLPFKFLTPVEEDFGCYYDTASNELLTIDEPKNSKYKRFVTEKFVLSGDTATLELVEESSLLAFRGLYENYIGYDAAEIAERRLNLYRTRYAVVELDPDFQPAFEVMLDNLKIRFTSRYRVRDIWTAPSNGQGRPTMGFYPTLVNDTTFVLEGSNRLFNHFWPHPVEYRYVFDVATDFDLSHGDLNSTVEGEAFSFKASNTTQYRRCVYEITYASKTGIIDKSIFEAEKTLSKKMLDNRGFVLYKPTRPTKRASSNWQAAFVPVLLILSFLLSYVLNK